MEISTVSSCSTRAIFFKYLVQAFLSLNKPQRGNQPKGELSSIPHRNLCGFNMLPHHICNPISNKLSSLIRIDNYSDMLRWLVYLGSTSNYLDWMRGKFEKSPLLKLILPHISNWSLPHLIMYHLDNINKISYTDLEVLRTYIVYGRRILYHPVLTQLPRAVWNGPWKSLVSNCNCFPWSNYRIRKNLS